MPAAVGQLSGLGVLYLSDNQLTSVPEVLKNMTNLKVLDLLGNQIDQESINNLKKSLPGTEIAF